LFPPDFVRPRTTDLAVTATQIFEFADEGFRLSASASAAAISIRQILVMCVINATAPSRHAARRSKAQSQRRWLQSPENQNYFRESENRRRVKTGAKPIPVIGARRSLRPEYRYKISSKRK
jgi:hypothetical protein